MFEELVPSVSPLLKKHIRLGHTGIVDHSIHLSIPDFFKSIQKKEWTEAIKNQIVLYKCITINSKYQYHMAACCTYHRPTYFSYLLLNRSHAKKTTS